MGFKHIGELIGPAMERTRRVYGGDMATVKIQRNTADAQIPRKRYATDTGYDIVSPYSTVIPAHGMMLVNTELRMAPPAGVGAFIFPRSSLSSGRILVPPGTIDGGYRGDIWVNMLNLNGEPYPIKEGDRVAQLVFLRLAQVEIQEVDELPNGDRGRAGFGSTGR